MNLQDLKHLRECNEFDMLLKIIEIAENSKKRVEQSVKGNKQAGIDVRDIMQDIRFISEIIRNNIQIRSGYFERKSKATGKNPLKTIIYKGREIPNNKLEKAIVDKEEVVEKEKIRFGTL